MTQTLPDIIDAEYVTAPITGPEDIHNPELKSGVEALVLVQGTKPLLTDVSLYTPSAQPPNEDPRGLLRRVFGAVYSSFLFPTKKKKLAREREQQRQIAYAQSLYGWAEQNKDGVIQSLQQLRAAYDGISAFLKATDSGIQNLREGLDRAEARTAETVQYVQRLDGKMNSPEYKSQLETTLGAEAAIAAIKQYQIERDASTQEMAQLAQIRTYVDSLAAEFVGDAAASRQSLALIANVMRETVPLRLRLEATLRRYKGLTAHEIDAAQATQFLGEMRTVVGDLDKGIRQVHSAWTAQAEIFVATSDLPYEPALSAVPLLDALPKEYEK